MEGCVSYKPLLCWVTGAGLNMSGKAIFNHSKTLWRSLAGRAFAVTLLAALMAGSAWSAETGAQVNTSSTKSDNSNSRNKNNTNEAVALGTVSVHQQNRGYRLFGNSGLTLSHSSQVSQKVYASPNPQYDRSYSYSFGMGLRLTKEYTSSLSFSLSHQPNALEQDEQLKLRNTSLDISRTRMALGGGYTVSPGLGVRLPVGRDVVKRESLRFGLAPSAAFGLPPLWSGSKLGASYSLSGTYNNHKYTHNSSGSPNVRWGANHSLRLAYPVVKNVTVSAGVNHGLAWTTLGTMREYVGHSETLSWQVSPNASLSVGHSSQGELYALDGVVYDFSFLSERNSVVFGRLSLSI
jgi:hypothetical protein